MSNNSASAMYDEAVAIKLKNWFQNTDINIYSPADTRQLFEVVADKTNDSPIKLPLLCIRRKGGYNILNPNRKPLTFDGLNEISGNQEEKSIQLNAIPISISYQLDVYARYFEEADTIIRDLIFNIINAPTFQVVVPYNDINLCHKSNIRLEGDTVEDNSDISERLARGQFTRLSLGLVVDDAYLWDAPSHSNITIDYQGLILTTDFENGKEDNVIEELHY